MHDTLIATWLILTEASSFSAVTMLPYAAAQQGRRINAALLLRTVIASHLLFGAMAALGLALGRELGLGAPLIEALVKGDPISIQLVTVLTWCATGVALAAVLWVLDLVLFSSARGSLAAAQISIPPASRRFGAVLYGAIAEEVLARLGILTISAYLIALSLEAIGRPAPGAALVLAIVISAVTFALGHLPSTARLTPLRMDLVLRSMVLNGVTGLAFGTLFCLHGLESAMTAHGSANLMIQFVLPLLHRR